MLIESEWLISLGILLLAISLRRCVRKVNWEISG